MQNLLKRAYGRAVLTAIAVAALVIAPLFSAQSAHATTAGINGLIAYNQSSFAGPIKTLKPDLNNLATSTLTLDNSRAYYGAMWSPDGTKVAYLDTAAPTTLYIAKADGTVLTTLADGRFYGEVSWSPDGTRFVVATRNGTSYFNIYTMKADGTDYTQVTNFAYNVRNPQYSPDGTKIAYHSDQDHDIHVMNVDGSNDTNLTNGAFVGSENPIWSPNGTKMLFVTLDVSSNRRIKIMNADGSAKMALTGTLTNSHAVFSPDGTKVAYPDTDGYLHIMNVDGTNDVIYSHDDINMIDWQPATVVPQGPASFTLTTVNGKVVLDVAAAYADAYGGGIDKSAVGITSAPAHGTATVDPTTGVITYTAAKVSAHQSSFLDSVFGAISPPAYAAAPADQFSFKVCSSVSTSLCTTSSVSVFAGAPNTGVEPQDTTTIPTIASISVLLVIGGVWLSRVSSRRQPSDL